MRTITAPTLLITITLAGCAIETPAEPLAVRPSFAASAQLPISGSCDVQSTTFVKLEPPILHQVSTAVCAVSHLGRVAVRTEQQINIVTGTQVAQATYTTANGDVLNVSSVGTSTPTGPASIQFSGVATIAGGTGRFVDASGQMNVKGKADNAAGTASFTLDGWITYDAAQRR